MSVTWKYLDLLSGISVQFEEFKCVLFVSHELTLRGSPYVSTISTTVRDNAKSTAKVAASNTPICSFDNPARMQHCKAAQNITFR